MNDNIKKIPMLERFAAQSLVESDGELIFSKEKFAELIVGECMEQIHIHSRGPCGDYHGEWYESDILKHFGVEE